MKKILIAASALLVLASCAKEMSNPGKPIDGTLQTIKVNVASFDGENATKTAVTPSGSFTWSADDQIGIYPLAVGGEQTSQQIIFKINGGDASSATFTGTGWGLITNNTFSYFSYYPYSSSTTHDKAVVSFSDGLTQASSSSTAHLGVNDFLYAPSIKPATSTSAEFNFYHIGALVNFEITVPEEAKTKAFKKVEISASEDLFMVSGEYNPSTTVTRDPKSEIYGPELSNVVYTDKITLNLNDITPDSNGILHAYFLIGPAAVKGKTLNVKIITKEGKPYIGEKTNLSSDIKSQNHKQYEVAVTAVPLGDPVNLSVNALGDPETANCYIVPSYGRYKFLANVKGNGVNPLALEETSIDLTSLTPVVIWETVNTDAAPAENSIVSTVVKDGNYVAFTAEGTEGNALIALKDGSNNIVWSWHIWVTSADLEKLKQTYPNGAGIMMDRNLGALSATPGDGFTLGFCYQWGRPFPITAGCSKNGKIDGTRMATTNSSVWGVVETTSERGTLAYSAKHPTHFICTSASNTLKGTSTVSGNWIWTVNEYATSESMPLFWGSTKTMYDPCPVDWKVPAGGASGIWANAEFNETTFPWNEYGRTFTPNEAYYPANGYIASNTGIISAVGTGGYYWSVSKNLGNSYYLFFNATTMNTSYSSARAIGFCVRPCRDTK